VDRTVLIATIEDELALTLRGFTILGKGQHPASLNSGDCMAHALAMHLGLPHLFKGDDFTRCDVEAVPIQATHLSIVVVDRLVTERVRQADPLRLEARHLRVDQVEVQGWYDGVGRSDLRGWGGGCEPPILSMRSVAPTSRRLTRVVMASASRPSIAAVRGASGS